MGKVHFLNVKEGDCNIIEHNSGRVSVIDVCNAKKESSKNICAESFDVIGNFCQKYNPENPIKYIKNNIRTNYIFRFILTHPDMDHMDGIKDFFEEFVVDNFWDTNNDKEINDFSNCKYKQEDWDFYQKLRTEKISRIYYAGDLYEYFNRDGITILSPGSDADAQKYNDLSYVLLYQECGKKILFGGDAEEGAWDLIAQKYKKEISNVDVLIASHHGRKTGGSRKYLSILNPKLVLMGNAKSEYLDYYGSYPSFTNNQAGNIILDIQYDGIGVHCSNGNFAQKYTKEQSYMVDLKNELWFLEML